MNFNNGRENKEFISKKKEKTWKCKCKFKWNQRCENNACPGLLDSHFTSGKM